MKKRLLFVLLVCIVLPVISQAWTGDTKSTWSWVIIEGAFMLLIIAVLLYRQALLRKKNDGIINQQNDQLQHLAREKEWLLQEVHHRVKNNLHTVIGLLESQAAYLEDDALKANEISKHRIYAMSLIHQQLYKAAHIKTIDMSVYLPELLDYLRESFGIARTIRFQLAIERLKLGVSQALPIGLIVNEAVTNAIRYAFPPGRSGTISVSMHQANDKISLDIADDGVGIDPVVINAESTSLGMKLMNGLTEDIDGEIRFTNENGTKITIVFNLDPFNECATFQSM
jgi:two-component sensor histidine kinase